MNGEEVYDQTHDVTSPWETADPKRRATLPPRCGAGHRQHPDVGWCKCAEQKYCPWRCRLVCLCGKEHGGSWNVKTHPPRDPGIPPPGIYPKGLESRSQSNVTTAVIFVELFTVAQARSVLLNC